MALINCDECGASISDKAAACPKCGNPIRVREFVSAERRASSPVLSAPHQARGSKMSKRITSGVVIGIIALVALTLLKTESPRNASESASQSSSTAPVPPQASTQAPPVPPPPTIIDISAEQLYAEYKENEVLADNKYKGQWLHVTGSIVEIGKDYSDDPYVTLLGESAYSNVRALFRKSMNGQLSELHRGQQISLTCLGKGRLVGDAILDCRQDHVPKYRPSAEQGSATTQSASSQTTKEAPSSDPSAPVTYETSFDCSKARVDAEHLICGDAELAELDRNMAATFAQAKAAAKDQQEFARSTRRNWNWRNKNCVDKNCLSHWYADQQRQFDEIIALAGASATQ